MSATRKLTVQCPCCEAELVVDVATGAVLSHRVAKAAPAQGKSFESLLADLDASKSRADEVFTRELGAMRDRERLLDEKFQEALRRAEEDPDDRPPPRPWELD